MGSGEMEVDERVRVSEYVTVLLVPISTVVEGNAAKKCKLDKSRERPTDGPVELLLAISADASKLRECSKYFATCMSERWPTHGTPREFRLEAHTEVRFYEDCFNRIYFPYKAIKSVGECIELLKVASQIAYAHVLDIGVKYLAAAPWSGEEEKHIRSFCDSGQLSLDSISDLHKRLQLGTNAREREEIHLKHTNGILKRYLQLSRITDSSVMETLAESRRVFKEGFQAIVSGSGPGKSAKLLLKVLTLVSEESEKLLISLKKALEVGTILDFHILNFCWLFDTASVFNAGQVVLEQILKHEDIAPLLRSKFRSFDHDPLRLSYEAQFESMLCRILLDVLEGRLFLTTSQRIAFFKQWNAFFTSPHNNPRPDCPLGGALVYRFISTLPHEDQEEIYRNWVSSLDDAAEKLPNHHVLAKAHSMWIKHLVAQAEILANSPECSSTG
ncbi:hypothetical protein M758_9G021600 [Ceratodon purpureus]|nr:hypothetical protein M758_9G021600 [Ceratodon purpureus]